MNLKINNYIDSSKLFDRNSNEYKDIVPNYFETTITKWCPTNANLLALGTKDNIIFFINLETKINNLFS